MTSSVNPIQSMRMKNLRRFTDTGKIELRPLNFVFGKNGSGKTTLLRSSLLFRQLVEAIQHSSISNALAGPYVDFGSYQEAVHNSQLSKDIVLSFVLDIKEQMDVYLGGRRRRSDNYENVTVEIALHWNKTRGHMQFSSIGLLKQDGSPIARIKRLGPNKVHAEMPYANVNQAMSVSSELGFHTFRTIEFEMINEQKVEQSSERRLVNLEMFVAIESIGMALKKLHHIGPLRDMPERAYRTDQLSLSNDSTKTVLSILSQEREAIPVVTRALRDMGMAKGIELTALAPGYAGISVLEYGSNRKDSLADVGFGVSQVLPIIARIATAGQGDLLLIEQPELHLHPETQGAFVDTMISLAGQRRAGLFVESHSENMLLRLRRRVASGDLNPDDLQILVVSDGEIRRAEIDSTGALDYGAFPVDFFEEDWLDAMEIAKAAAGRVR